MLRLLALLTALIATPLAAEEVVLGLSKKNVSITANFDGSEILIFGAVKQNLKVVEVPVTYRARTYGDTNISRWSTDG